MTWRYLLQSLPDEGIIDPNLELRGVSITNALSGPGGLSGSLDVGMPHLLDADGRSLIQEWKTAIWAEKDGQIRGGGIVDKAIPDGERLSVECVGIAGIPQGQPYEGEPWHGVDVDPLDVVRRCWADVLRHEGSMRNIAVDDTASSGRVGVEAYVPLTETTAPTVSKDDGPVRLNWWDVQDMGALIDEYAQRGWFDYAEETRWSADGLRLEHRLRLFAPRKGRRLDGPVAPRFVYGENTDKPSITHLSDRYASAIIVLGSGEGREKLRSPAIDRRDGGLRRVETIVDENLKRQEDVDARANQELLKRGVRFGVTSLDVWDHPNAPVGSWQVGDEIRVIADLEWLHVDQWARVMESTIRPEDGDVATLTLKVEQ